jgi:hypothetical protein
MTDLLYLIGLGLAPLGLQVQDFFDSVPPENMMASPDALAEAWLQRSWRSPANGMFASDVRRLTIDDWRLPI